MSFCEIYTNILLGMLHSINKMYILHIDIKPLDVLYHLEPFFWQGNHQLYKSNLPQGHNQRTISLNISPELQQFLWFQSWSTFRKENVRNQGRTLIVYQISDSSLCWCEENWKVKYEHCVITGHGGNLFCLAGSFGICC